MNDNAVTLDLPPLLGALLGRLPLASGAHWRGPSVVVGEISQTRDLFADRAQTSPQGASPSQQISGKGVDPLGLPACLEAAEGCLPSYVVHLPIRHG